MGSGEEGGDWSEPEGWLTAGLSTVLTLRTRGSEGNSSVTGVIMLYWVLFGSANHLFPECGVQNIYLYLCMV